ncbi:bifunctional 2-polyprenyl-6-hydroxyphenol methylase/3-demethylubiquinol 3-O-methyltransferase UbiG [Shewanella waksmanii]|uniref:bifunctional 2-polyprenyl-6-hydroxyphenol methylase/3-demethylubiquinol 3-O-methyltransferase UbiG n=1 Tax=Shewanella waksmanii TaxID=213783 RepID=UPI00049187A2|nr:bifunctional 2-polyprenyl-6-hydroxyphenol methylase/3-demethylubiquinol 3-O-methyltransferase UbiG [Shewanella waksmanii]
MLDKSRLSSLSKLKAEQSLDQLVEIAKFDALAKEWRDPKGRFKHVLAFNQTRLLAIKTAIAHHFSRSFDNANPLADLKLLDIGCGAGLLTEPLASYGADVLGIDASEHNVSVASQHAKNSDIKVTYQHCLAAEIEHSQTANFDIILNTEVIEHVTDQQALVNTCARLLKPGGLLVMATLNRTWQSYVIGILGAEYVMRYLPVGTHNWHYFVKPHELEMMLAHHQIDCISCQGMQFNPFNQRWRISQNTQVNYLLFATKPLESSPNHS